VSQYPRIVLSDVTVLWDPHANGALRGTFVRKGTVVDVKPGSALETAYGPANLSAVVPVAQRGDGTCWSKSALSNLRRPRWPWPATS
jgi:hypothetical protein